VECRDYSVHYEGQEESVCVHHETRAQKALRAQDSFREMHGRTIDILNEALRMTEEGLARRGYKDAPIFSPALPSEDARGVA
jgi:hypothetical protein